MSKPNKIAKILSQLFAENDVIRQQAKQTLIELGQSVVPELIFYLEEALNEENPHIFTAISVLASLDYEKAFPYIFSELMGKNTLEAAALIAKNDYPKVASYLLNVVRQNNEIVQIQALQAIGTLKLTEAVKFLIEIMEKEEDYSVVKVNIVETLGEIGDDRAIDPLLAQLSDEFVVPQVIEALANLDQFRTLPIVIEALNTSDNLLVQYSAATALSKFKSKEAAIALQAFIQDATKWSKARERAAQSLVRD